MHDHERVTTLQVTHDFDEALRLGDVVAVLAEGRIAQLGAPEEVFRFPNSAFVAKFIGTGTVLLGRGDPPGARADGDGPFAAWFDSAPLSLEVVAEREGPAHAVLRPEDLMLSREPIAGLGPEPVCRGGEPRRARGAGKLSSTSTPGGPLTAAVTTASAEELGLQPGVDSRRDRESHRHSSRVVRIRPMRTGIASSFLFLGPRRLRRGQVPARAAAPAGRALGAGHGRRQRLDHRGHRRSCRAALRVRLEGRHDLPDRPRQPDAGGGRRPPDRAGNRRARHHRRHPGQPLLRGAGTGRHLPGGGRTGSEPPTSTRRRTRRSSPPARWAPTPWRSTAPAAPLDHRRPDRQPLPRRAGRRPGGDRRQRVRHDGRRTRRCRCGRMSSTASRSTARA